MTEYKYKTVKLDPKMVIPLKNSIMKALEPVVIKFHKENPDQHPSVFLHELLVSALDLIHDAAPFYEEACRFIKDASDGYNRWRKDHPSS